MPVRTANRHPRAERALLVAVLLITAACSSPSASSPSEPTAVPSTGPQAVPFQVTVNDLPVSGHCIGARDPGQPVVVLQSGNGGGAGHLSGIEQHMVSKAMVCAFGRPGTEANPAPPDLPRTINAVVAEVHDILAAAGVAPPYFLVGQSAGAVVVFMFAQAYADEVAGFVAMNGNPPYKTWVAEAKRIPIPQAPFDEAVADFSGQNPEKIDFRSNESMLTNPLPATMPYAVMYDEDCGGDPDCVVEWEAAIFQRLASVGKGGRFIRAKGAGHEIHQTRPQLVYDTIDKVWATATR
jgi:alpha/beta hydrolase fold